MKKLKNDSSIEFTQRFNKRFEKIPDEIKGAFIEMLDLFEENPNNPVFGNHALREKYAGYRSIDITGDWRAVFKEIKSGEGKIIKFHTIGTHKDLYGQKAKLK